MRALKRKHYYITIEDAHHIPLYLLSMNIWYVCMMYICVHTIHMTVDRYVCRKMFVKNSYIHTYIRGLII